MSEEVRVLRPGEALELSALGATDQLVVGLRTLGGAPPDLIALLVDEASRVRTDDDLIFYNNTASADGAVSHLDRYNECEWLRIYPGRIDADVARVVIGCADGVLETGTPSELQFAILDGAGALLATSSFKSETTHRAMILFEVYRRAGSWRCRLLAQGYDGGLAAFVTEYGVDVAQESEATNPAPVPPLVTTEPAPSGDADPAANERTQAPPGANQPQTHSHVSPPTGGPGLPQQWIPSSPPRRRGGLFTSRKRAELAAQNEELTRLLSATGALDNAAIAAEKQRLAGQLTNLVAEADRRRADLADLDARLSRVRAEIATAEGDAELAEIGIYRYRHRLDDSIAYKGAIDSLRDSIKSTAKAGRAVTGDTSWTVNGSLAKGRKMVNEVSKLMLRAYNADTDHAMRTMRAYRLDSALARLDTTRRTIARLGTTMNIAITEEYHRLRRKELELTADYLSKAEEEKERQRELRAQQREEQRVLAELKREQERLERDRTRYASALAQLEARGEGNKASELRAQLADVDNALAGLAERAANRRLGHVYVISNVGAFGRRMVKIGMTRRLEPMDRVRELGDASVPFRFDVHALIFSEDAVSLETALHQRFADQRVNRVNLHREFFYITPAEVRAALAELGSQYLLTYTEEVEAPEWRQSGGPDRALLPT